MEALLFLFALLLYGWVRAVWKGPESKKSRSGLPRHSATPPSRHRRRAIEQVKAYEGSKIRRRTSALAAAEEILPSFHELGLEAAIVLYLNGDNVCAKAEVHFGDETSVYLPPERLRRSAEISGAEKVVMMHNHPDNRPIPSDPDVNHAAFLTEVLDPGISLVDDFVWCRGGKIKSVLNTKRYKDMMREY